MRRVKSWFTSYANVLTKRDVRLLFIGQIVSASGSWAYNVGLLAFVYGRTHSLAWVGAAGFVRFVPSLLLSAYSGVVAERLERVRLMVGADLLCTLWQVGLVAVALAHGPVALALCFSALTSASGVVYSPSVTATIPDLVDEADLVAANALNATIQNLTIISGPAIGALLLLAGSPTVVFIANAASFALSALLVSRIKHRTPPVDVTEGGTVGILSQMAVGVRTIVSLPAARTLVAFSVLVSFVYGTDTVLFVGVAAHKLGTGTTGFGYLLGGLGIGGVLMAPAVDKLSARPRLALIILTGVAGYTVPTALLTIVHNPELAVVIEVVRGGSTLVVDVLAITALQRSVPKEQLARVFGVFFAFVLAAITLGTVLTPAVTSGFGLDGGLLTMAVAPFALALFGLPALLAIDRRTLEATTALAPRIAILEQLGIFAAATRPLLERLASTSEDRNFSAGDRIIEEGENADYLYVLLEGQVDVSASGEAGGAPQHIRTMVGPTYFGEIGILRHVPRTANVTALTPCQCTLIDGAALLDALNTSPASTSLMQLASSRLAVTHPSLHTAEDVETTPVGTV
jgi:CRP-like cAMP-binding protein/predicted MFS family arabinose efflux permease